MRASRRGCRLPGDVRARRARRRVFDGGLRRTDDVLAACRAREAAPARALRLPRRVAERGAGRQPGSRALKRRTSGSARPDGGARSCFVERMVSCKGPVLWLWIASRACASYFVHFIFLVPQAPILQSGSLCAPDLSGMHLACGVRATVAKLACSHTQKDRICL